MNKQKTSNFMKLIFTKTSIKLVMLLIFTLSIANQTKAQTQSISLEMKNKSRIEIFKEIEKISEYRFIYKSELLKDLKNISISAKNLEIKNIMEKVVANTNLTYKIDDLYITISKKPKVKKIQITGKVIDTQGNALPGVSVIEKGTSNGTVSDISGNYSLKATSDSKIEFSFIGMNTVLESIDGRKTIDVTLSDSKVGLEEVVVVGYGTQKKVNLTGAVETVSVKEMNKSARTSSLKSLQGQVAGLTIVDRGGLAGEGKQDISIRGITSLSGSTSPLILVDGIEQNLRDINPNEIESISVLKDASSTAIYGVRGANGVILVATKRAINSKLQVSYSGNFSLQEVTGTPDYVGKEDYMNLYNEAYTNNGQDAPLSKEFMQEVLDGKRPFRNWADHVYEVAPMYNNSLSIKSGNEYARFNVTFNHVDQEGIVKDNNNYKRKSVRLNTDINLSKKLKLQVDLNLRNTKTRKALDMDGVYWAIYQDYEPWAPLKNPDGTYAMSASKRNIDAMLQGGYYITNRDYHMGRAKLSYEIINDLVLSGEMYVTKSTKKHQMHKDKFDFYNEAGDVVGQFSDENENKVEYSEDKEVLLRTTLNYKLDLNKNNFKFLLGAERSEQEESFTEAYRLGAYSNKLKDINAGSGEKDGSGGYYNETRIGSSFGRLNYNYAEKYLFEANFRYDGHSYFHQNNRWDFFPSFSAGWRISEESFMKSIDWISNLKLRASYGETGSTGSLGRYQFLSNIYTNSNSYIGGKSTYTAGRSNFANTELEWETTKITDLGIDMGFLKNSLTVSFGVYQKDSDGLLNYSIPIPRTIGLNNPAVNSGEIRNRGWELSLGYNGSAGELNYSFRLNISDNFNEVISLTGTGPYYGWGSITKEGEELNSWYGYKTNGFVSSKNIADNKILEAKYPDGVPAGATTDDGGVYTPLQPKHPEAGHLKYVDTNKDGKINEDDRVILDESQPHLPFSINVAADYKGFDFSMFWQGVLEQNTMLDGGLMDGPNWGNFTHSDHLGRWTAEKEKNGESITWPRLQRGRGSYAVTDFALRDAAYIRLKNLQLGYTLPKNLLENIGLSKVRFYVSGDNLLTFSEEDLVDPEFPAGRALYTPQTKIYTIGLNVEF